MSFRIFGEFFGEFLNHLFILVSLRYYNSFQKLFEFIYLCFAFSFDFVKVF